MKSRHPLLAVLLCAAVSASATEWHVVGPRALGMGGAGVAMPTNGPIAAYWNPAALGRPTRNAYGLQVPLDLHYGVTGTVLEGANNLSNVQDACRAGAGAPGCTQADIDRALNLLDNPGNGIRIDGDGGLGMKIGRLAVFANTYIDVGAVPFVDRAVGVTPGNITTISNNSALILKGSQLNEFGVGYGHELPFVEGLYLGGNVKLMKATVGRYDFRILREDGEEDDFLKKFKDGAKASGNIGVDAGALWDVARTFDGVPLRPRFGITARNLNNPKFTQPDAAVAAGARSKYAINPQTRVGAAISPFSWWHIAADVDLSRNLTAVDNVASRQAGLGTEINVVDHDAFNLPLRVGFMRNLAEKGSGTTLTFGAGLNFLHFMVDASAALSPKKINAESAGGKSTRIPQEGRFAVQVALLFGGSDGGPGESMPPVENAPHDDQPVPSEKVRESEQKVRESDQKIRDASDKAHQDLDKEAGKPR